MFDISELGAREIFGETEVLDNGLTRVSEVREDREKQTDHPCPANICCY